MSVRQRLFKGENDAATGFVLSEGAGVLTLAAEEAVKAHGLRPRAEVLGVGWGGPLPGSAAAAGLGAGLSQLRMGQSPCRGTT